MSRTFISVVLATALSLAVALPAPVRADEQDIARAVGVAATLFVLGKAIQNARDKHDDKDRKDRHDGWQDRAPHPHGSAAPHLPRPWQPHLDDRHKPLPRVIGRPHAPQPAARHLLPRACLLAVSGARTDHVLAEGCLRQHGIRLNSLPDRCRMQVATSRGRATAFSERCLAGQGYRVAGGPRR